MSTLHLPGTVYRGFSKVAHHLNLPPTHPSYFDHFMYYHRLLAAGQLWPGEGPGGIVKVVTPWSGATGSLISLWHRSRVSSGFFCYVPWSGLPGCLCVWLRDRVTRVGSLLQGCVNGGDILFIVHSKVLFIMCIM